MYYDDESTQIYDANKLLMEELSTYEKDTKGKG